MTDISSPQYTAFAGARRIASGTPAAVAADVKAVIDTGALEPILIFDDASGRQVEMDFRGTVEDVLSRVHAPARPKPATGAPGPGRPKLGVVAREVTLLPRHWEWLNSQPGGASVTLRKLVEVARREHEGTDRVRLAREAAYRFMTALAGNLPGYEEATRALFAGDGARFAGIIAAWPDDIAAYAQRLAEGSFI